MDNVAKRVELKLELTPCSKKCEYCDWEPMCCEWCGKLKSNKRKITAENCIVKNKKK